MVFVAVAALLGCSRSAPAPAPLPSRSNEPPPLPARSNEPAPLVQTSVRHAGLTADEAAPEGLTAADEEPYDYRTESLDGLRVGLDTAAVKQRLGAPPSESAVAERGADGLFATTWEWPQAGITIELVSPNRHGPFEVDALFVRAPCRLQTEKGIGIGANSEAIARAYGTEHTHVGEDQVIVGSPYGGLRFELERGVVRSIFIGASAE